MLLSTGALPSADDTLYTTTKFLQTQSKNSDDRRGNKSTTFLQNVEKGKYCIRPHCTLLQWRWTPKLYWWGGSLGIRKYYTVSLVSWQLSQHILMDAGLLRNKAAVLMRMMKETFCRRPVNSWEDNYWPFDWFTISFPANVHACVHKDTVCALVTESVHIIPHSK